jgi:hypothetical protein
MPRLTDLTGQNITTQATATYAENISAGDNVKLNSSGQLAKWGAGEFGASLTVGQVKSSFTGTAFEYQCTAYAKNRSLFFIATANQSGDEQLVVIERNSLTDTVTRSEFALTGVEGITAMCFLENENKLIVLQSRNSIYEAFAYTYTNGVLTLDQSQTFSGQNILQIRQGALMQNSAGGDVAVFGGLVNPGGGYVVSVGYVSGALTVNSTQVNAAYNGGTFAAKWDSTNDKGLLAYLWETGDSFNCYSVTYVGVTPTLSSVDTETVDWQDNSFDIEFDPISSTFLVAGKQTSANAIRYVTVDCSGANPVISSVTDLATSTIQASTTYGHQLVYDGISGKYLLSSQDPDGTNQCKVLTLSSGVLSLDNETEFTTVTTSSGSCTNLFYDESYQAVVLVFREPAAGYEWNMGIGRLDSNDELVDFIPDQDKLIGVAIDTKTTGQLGKYRLLDKYKGVLIKNLTGLIPGQEYYINALGGLTTNITSDFYGLAISATQAITSTIVGLLSEIKKLTIGEGRVVKSFTGSDNTASGTYTTIVDQGGSGALKSITCSSSNSSAAVALKLTINGVEEVLFGSLNANPLRGHSANESVTWHCDIPYSGGVKVEIDSSSTSYTTNCTVVLHQD